MNSCNSLASLSGVLRGILLSGAIIQRLVGRAEGSAYKEGRLADKEQKYVWNLRHSRFPWKA